MPRQGRPVPGLLQIREPRVSGRDDPPSASPSPSRPGYESPFHWRLAAASWATWALAVFAVGCAVGWQRPEPLVGALVWAVCGGLLRVSRRILDRPVTVLRALAQLGLTVVLVALLVVGAAFVAAGERA